METLRPKISVSSADVWHSVSLPHSQSSMQLSTNNILFVGLLLPVSRRPEKSHLEMHDKDIEIGPLCEVAVSTCKCLRSLPGRDLSQQRAMSQEAWCFFLMQTVTQQRSFLVAHFCARSLLSINCEANKLGFARYSSFLKVVLNKGNLSWGVRLQIFTRCIGSPDMRMSPLSACFNLTPGDEAVWFVELIGCCTQSSPEEYPGFRP